MESTPLYTVLGPNRLASMNYILRAHGIDSFLGSSEGEADIKIRYHGDTWTPNTGLSINKLRIGFYLSNNGVYLGTWGIKSDDNGSTTRSQPRAAVRRPRSNTPPMLLLSASCSHRRRRVSPREDTTIRWKQRVIEVCDNWRTGRIPHCKALRSSPHFPARYMEVTMLSVESVIDLVKKFM